jgi:hypothetical protein
MPALPAVRGQPVRLTAVRALPRLRGVRRTRIGVGGRRTVVSGACLAVACGLAVAGAGLAAPPSRATTAAATSSFVSVYPLSDASEIDRYSLANGRQLGVLVHIPTLRSTASSSTVSTPHLLANGDYLLTLDHGDVCGSSHGACHASPNSCSSRVETLDPDSKKVRPLFTVSGAWRVDDAVPSPDGRSVALVESGCSGDATRLEVRTLATGLSHLVTGQLSQCSLESDVAWSPTSSKLVFAYGNPRNLDALPAGCALATAAAGRVSRPASWALIRLRSTCGFDSAAFDSTGIVAIVGCSDDDGGTNSTLRQYDGRGRVLNHRALDSFDPPQYGLATQLESDSAVHDVLVSEIVSDDPDVSDVWTYNGTTLRHVGDYFGDAILAEP